MFLSGKWTFPDRFSNTVGRDVEVVGCPRGVCSAGELSELATASPCRAQRLLFRIELVCGYIRER